jgi:hypothetical protein
MSGVSSPIAAVGVFSGDGIQIIVSGDEEDALRRVIKCMPGRCVCWEESGIESLAVGDGIGKWLRRPFLSIRDERA